MPSQFRIPRKVRDAASAPSAREAGHAPLRLPGGPAPTLALLVSALALLALVALRWPPLIGLDAEVVRAWHSAAVANSALTEVNRVLSGYVWDTWTFRLLALAAAGRLMRRGRPRTAAWLVLTVLAGAVVQQALKWLVGRDRPALSPALEHAAYAAFPSGHAMTATVVSGAFLVLLHRHDVRGRVWRWAVAVAVVSVAGVGATRVWLAVHWPSDVLGGWLLGALCVVVAARWCPPGRREQKR